MQPICGVSWYLMLSLTLNTWWATSEALAQAPSDETADRTVPVDLSGYNRESGVIVQSRNQQLLVTWPMREDEGEFAFDFLFGEGDGVREWLPPFAAETFDIRSK